MGLDVGTRNGLLSVRTVHAYLTCIQLTDSTVTYLDYYGTGVTQRGDTSAVVLATKIRLENGNDDRMAKKKAMTAVRSKRKLLR